MNREDKIMAISLMAAVLFVVWVVVPVLVVCLTYSPHIIALSILVTIIMFGIAAAYVVATMTHKYLNKIMPKEIDRGMR